MARTTLYVLGAIFMVTGVWAYFMTPVAGIFPINSVHAAVHILTGIIMLAVALWAPAQSAFTTKIFGVIYVLVAVWGFVIGSGLILGLIDVDLMDNILHTVTALALLWVGFVNKSTVETMEAMGTGI